MIALMKTSEGDIKIKLFDSLSPKSVANFVELAEGTKKFEDPKTKEWIKKPFYNGLIFHRVIKDFMIQGGCPSGDGYGTPGFNLEDERNPELKHDKPGILAMANTGMPNSSGSQFYITTVPCPHLDGGYNIFGEVIEGMEVVHKIEDVPTGAADRPQSPITIESVTIER